MTYSDLWTRQDVLITDHGGGEVSCLLRCDPSCTWEEWFSASEPVRSVILTETVTTADGITYQRMSKRHLSQRTRYQIEDGQIYLSVGIWTRSDFWRYTEDATRERDGLPPKRRNKKLLRGGHWITIPDTEDKKGPRQAAV